MIKRVIGSEGDHVYVSNTTISLNNLLISNNNQQTSVGSFYEKVNSTRYQTYYTGCDLLHQKKQNGKNLPIQQKTIIGDNEYYVLGDNRCHSKDSRVVTEKFNNSNLYGVVVGHIKMVDNNQ